MCLGERASAVFIKGADCSHGSSGDVRGRLPAARLQTVFNLRSGEVDTHPYWGGGHKPRHIARNLNTHACTSESFEESL